MVVPRLRQAVLAAHDLDAVAGELRRRLSLGDPFADPGVGHFGLRNAVFALSDTFLEIVSPVREGTAAGRLLERRGSDCGYMLMFQVGDLAAARERVRQLGIREVFEVSLEDISEVHLHPSDVRAAIVSISQPTPPRAWRWGGPNWQQRSAPGLSVSGARLAVTQPESVADRWAAVLDAPPAQTGVRFSADEREPGLVEISLRRAGGGESFTVGGVQFVFEQEEEQ